MKISKDELAKILKLKKVLELELSEEEISSLTFNMYIKENEFHTNVVCKKNIIQCVSSIENPENIRLRVAANFNDLLKVCKTFTKKTDIELILNDNEIIFKGIQDKNEVISKLPLSKESALNKFLPKNEGNNLDSLDFLTSLLACHKLAKEMAQIDVESLIKVSLKDNYLQLFANSSNEILKCFTNYQSMDKISFYIEKYKIRAITTLIQESKSFTLKVKIVKEGILVESGSYRMYSAKSSKPGLDLEKLVENIEEKMEFKTIGKTIEEKTIFERNMNERIAYIEEVNGINVLKSNDINQVFSNISKIEVGYSDKRLTDLLKIKSLEVEKFSISENNVLKLENSYLNYYLLPKKRT